MSRAIDRLMILGLDGATWTVLDPMMRRGAMPNLEALLGQSAHGTLRSTIPPVTTAAWTTMMTGCSPVRHGIFDHRYFDASTWQMRVNHAGRRRAPTIWGLLSEAGLAVASLNVPGTYPPPRVNGVVVSGMDAPHLDAALSGYPRFAERLRSEVPRYSLRYFWKKVPATLEELEENARQTCESFRGRAEGGLLADEMVADWSVLMVQFQNLDPFQHRCWRYLRVDETGIEDAPWNRAAESVLRGLDGAIGLLLERAERRGAAVMVVSDHGFGPCQGRISVNRILRDAGLARMPGPLGALGRALRLAGARVRRHQQRKGDPASRAAAFDSSIDGQLPLDWSRTLVFAPHQDTAAMVYLNSRQRRARAPLATPRQIDEARNETAIALATARHAATGERLFPQVISLADVYDLDPAELGYPDLIALPHERYWVRTRLGRGAMWVDNDPNLPGTHRPEGVVALRATGIEPGRMSDAALEDIAPTVLALLGVPPAATMEGTVLPCVPGALRTRTDGPARTIPRPHDPVGGAEAGFEFSAEEQAVIEQRLADLGYLE
jgi:predicted AlkP superfamily phosphohydrolase/phosphomutase